MEERIHVRTEDRRDGGLKGSCSGGLQGSFCGRESRVDTFPISHIDTF